MLPLVHFLVDTPGNMVKQNLSNGCLNITGGHPLNAINMRIIKKIYNQFGVKLQKTKKRKNIYHYSNNFCNIEQPAENQSMRLYLSPGLLNSFSG
jgi:hypothetical protein